MSTQKELEKSEFPERIYGWRKEDPKVLEEIESLLLYRRGYISREPIDEEVVFIVSGGLDSSVAMDLVIREWNIRKIHPLFVRRSARATPYEEKAADFFINFYKQRYPGRMGDLRVVETEIPPLVFKTYAEPNRLQTLGHPMRNSALQTLGVQYANMLRAKDSPDLHTVLTATVGDDSFPHSSLAALRSVNLATCIDTGDWKWLVTSPLVDTQYKGRPLFKSDLIRYAVENSIPLERTRSCIEGGGFACGMCPECIGRLKSFNEVGISDPAEYSSN